MDANPSRWKVARPCSADWDKMRGDDRRRFCEQCGKFVHNVSAMTRSEREAFADPSNARECVFYCQRGDGAVADLSTLARLRLRFPILRLLRWSMLATLLPGVFTGCLVMGTRPPPYGLLPLDPDHLQTTNQTDKAESPK